MATNGHTPLRDFMSLRDAMDRFFDDRWVSPGPWLTFAGAGSTQSLPIDVYETPDDIVVRALVPGVKPENIDIQYQGGVLTLRTKVEIDRRRRGGVIHIRFASEDDLIRIYDDLTGRRR